MQRGTSFIACCVVALLSRAIAQNLATPVTKVTQMLEDMRVKSDKSKKEADAIYLGTMEICETIVKTKKGETEALGLEITKLGAEALQLTTDIDGLVTQINDDSKSYEQNSKLLADARKTRVKEGGNYQRDLAQYSVALASVQRAIIVMGKKAPSFMQVSESRKLALAGRAALQDAASSVRQLSIYKPEGGGLAKDEKIFDEFDALTTNAGAYKSGAGAGKGVLGILGGLKLTFQKAKDELMDKESKAKLTHVSAEGNLEKQLQVARSSLSLNRGAKAQKEETLTTKKVEFNQAWLNQESTEKYLAKTKQVCKQKKKSYEEMTKLRSQESAALARAVAIIKGTVVANSARLNSKAGKTLLQIRSRSQPRPDKTQQLVKSVGVFIKHQASKLNSQSLVLLANNAAVLAIQAPSDALAKVKKMIVDLIAKMKKDGAAEATQKAWCEAELSKNGQEKQTAQAGIEAHSASVAKIQADVKMLFQEQTLLEQGIKTSEKEKKELVADRAKEKQENMKTIKDAQESTTAVDAAITVLSEYYKNATKGAALTQQPKTVGKTIFTELTAADAEGPQVAEGSNVIAMLVVVRDGYKTLITKTQAEETKADELYRAQMKDTNVMIATSNSDVKHKGQLISDYVKMYTQKTTDLTVSKTALKDANENGENLKAPCLNGNAAKERKEQITAEIAALKESLSMMEAYKGSFLQETSASALIRQTADQVPAGAAQIKKVAALLAGIKKDVQGDLDSDTAAYKDMQKWCTATIAETGAAIKVQRDRDGELVTAIEISAQQKATLASQLSNLKSDVAKHSGSSDQMGQMRAKDMKTFQKSEKEAIVAIRSLRDAVRLLKGKYAAFDKQDKRSLKGEQEQLKKDKAALAPAKLKAGAKKKALLKLQLTHIADRVANALKLLPVREFNSAVSGQTGAILQGFLSRPEELLLPDSKRSGLTQVGSEVLSNGVNGQTILGILETLAETFTADLKAMQDKEKRSLSMYSSTRSAKDSQISAMRATTSTKEAQLAHYTTMNAQAKEDLAYLRETNRFDMQYLLQVKAQCTDSENEFKIRKKSREDEIAALSEGISILTAGAGAKPKAKAKKTLIHTAKRVSRVFVHQHTKPKKRTVLKIGTPKASKPLAAAMPKPALAVVAATSSTSFLEVLAKTNREGGEVRLTHVLATLESQMELAQRQLGMGPLTAGALKSVATQVDVVVVQLQKEKKLEIKKKDTCVTEKNDATEQRQRRVTDKAKLDNQLVTLRANIQSATDNLAAIATQLKELSTTQATASKTRAEASAAYKASVVEQQGQQKVLHEAIAALQKIYSENSGFLQSVHQPARATQPVAGRSASIADKLAPSLHVPISGVKHVRLVVKQHADPTSKGLDEGVKKNMDTKWKSVKNIKAKRTSAPKGFAKPLKIHGGGTGIIGILNIILEESESLIKQDVKDELNQVNLYLANLEKIKQLIAEKEKEVVMLTQVKSDNVMKKTEAEQQLKLVEKEMKEINEFLAIVDKQCKTSIQNFDANQAARAQEISDTIRAKEVLMGMTEDSGAALAQMAHRLRGLHQGKKQ